MAGVGGGRVEPELHPAVPRPPTSLAMRLDLFLKHSRLVPRRTVAQEICDAGAVHVNGSVGKPGRSVSVGDVLALRQRGKLTTVRVLRVPERPPPKAEAPTLYELVSVEAYE